MEFNFDVDHIVQCTSCGVLYNHILAREVTIHRVGRVSLCPVCGESTSIEGDKPNG